VLSEAADVLSTTYMILLIAKGRASPYVVNYMFIHMSVGCLVEKMRYDSALPTMCTGRLYQWVSHELHGKLIDLLAAPILMACAACHSKPSQKVMIFICRP
jgi:hypothetical protein